MGQCGEITDPGIECNQPTVLWGKCEKHLTPRERAVCELVQAADGIVRGAPGNDWVLTTTQCILLRDAIAAVKEAG